MFMLLSGEYPFSDDMGVSQMYEDIQNAKYEMRPEHWDKASACVPNHGFECR